MTTGTTPDPAATDGPPTTTPLLRATDLGKTYDPRTGGITAVHDATLTLTPGESLALMGPSGCGKSTLLAMLGLLTTPTTGTLHVLGQPAPTTENTRARLRNATYGYLHQDHAVIREETVKANITIPLEYAHPRIPRRRRHDLATTAATRVGIDRYLRTRAGKLSGGERQRVAIARALVTDARIILADEPTASLDRDTATHVIDLILTTTTHGTGIIIATHDERVAHRCDRVITMTDGTIVTTE